MFEPQEVECAQCQGEGFIRQNEWPFGPICEACNGTGWRPRTEDEENDAAEAAYEAMCTSEPPVSMKERHEAAWKLKQESRS